MLPLLKIQSIKNGIRRLSDATFIDPMHQKWHHLS